MTATNLMGLGCPAPLANEISNQVGTTSTLRGTFTANGATPVTVVNANIAADDMVIITLKTAGGTVGALPRLVTRTNGTGFNVNCTASDTSIYDYRILKA
jgi:hypothetical protein